MVILKKSQLQSGLDEGPGGGGGGGGALPYLASVLNGYVMCPALVCARISSEFGE